GSQQHKAEEGELLPREDRAQPEREHREADHDPADRGHDAQHGPDDPPDRAAEDREHTARPERETAQAHAEGPRERGCVLERGCRHAQAARYAGGSMSSRMRETTSSALTPAKSDSGSITRRWASTGTASSRTSSGMT